jgi:branched-chain amino acid aminotransferase
MPEKIWINGMLHPAETPVITGLNRGFLLGEGLFETMAVINGRIWKLERHIKRLQRGLDGLNIPLEVTHDFILDMLEALLLNSDDRHGALRLTISSGDGGRGLIPSTGHEPTVCAFMDKVRTYRLGPTKAHLAATRRNHLTATCQWKVTSYMDNLLAMREAQACGASEAVMLNAADQLCCFSTGNLLLWDGDVLSCPHPATGALPGTTLELLLSSYASVLPIQEKVHDHKNLKSATGLYKLSSLSGIQPIASLDERHIQSENMPLLMAIRKIIREDVIAECGSFASEGMLPWLHD